MTKDLGSMLKIIQERCGTPEGDQVIGVYPEGTNTPTSIIACHMVDGKKVFHIQNLDKVPGWWALSSYIHVDILMNYKYEFVLEKDYA